MIATAPQNQTEPKKEQFFMATPEVLKKDYKNKILTAEGYVYYIIRAKRAALWEWRLNVKQFCAEWELPERTFYYALSNLRAKNLISWRSGDNTVVLWWGKEVTKIANIHSSHSPNSQDLYTVKAPQDVAEPVQDVAEENAETLAVAQSCNSSYSLQIDPEKHTDFKKEVCVFSEKFLDQDPECGQQNIHHHDDETHEDAINGSRTTLLKETNQNPIPESLTTLLDQVETLQVVDTISHEDQGSAAPRHKTLQKPLQKQEWLCPGNDAEKAAFLKMKGELLAKDKKCLPVEGRTAALGWANRNPEAANLLWEDWQHQVKQQQANQNIVLATVPEFHRMSSEEHASLLEKFMNVGGEAFIALCSWHEHWLQFATMPMAKKRIDGLTPEIIKQIREALRCTA